jgi:hypothetical protein
MKKSLLALAFVAGSFFGLSSQAVAQHSENKNIVKINPLSLGLATANFSYERLLGERTSAQLGFFYTGAKYAGNGFSGFAVTPEFRYYMSKRGAGSGFYVAPFARYWAMNATVKGDFSDAGSGGSIQADERIDITVLAGGLCLGSQFRLGNRVTLDTFFGPQLMNSKLKYESNSQVDGEQTELPGFLGGGNFPWLRAGLTIGVAF